MTFSSNIADTERLRDSKDNHQQVGCCCAGSVCEDNYKVVRSGNDPYLPTNMTVLLGES